MCDMLVLVRNRTNDLNLKSFKISNEAILVIDTNIQIPLQYRGDLQNMFSYL